MHVVYIQYSVHLPSLEVLCSSCLLTPCMPPQRLHWVPLVRTCQNQPCCAALRPHNNAKLSDSSCMKSATTCQPRPRKTCLFPSVRNIRLIRGTGLKIRVHSRRPGKPSLRHGKGFVSTSHEAQSSHSMAIWLGGQCYLPGP